MAEVNVGDRYTALVDDEDVDIVSGYRWRPLKSRQTVYAVARTGSGPKVLMHRLILNAPRGMEVDHIDHNGLNNRRSNIRLCTRMQNSANTQKTRGQSKYKGVSFDVARGGWVAQIVGRRGSGRYLGRYDSEEAAAVAYNIAAGRQFGEFACLNDVDISAASPRMNRPPRHPRGEQSGTAKLSEAQALAILAALRVGEPVASIVRRFPINAQSVYNIKNGRTWAHLSREGLMQYARADKSLTYNGITDTIAGWARRTGLAAQTLSGRLLAGWTIAEALNTSAKDGKRRRRRTS